MVSNHLVFGLWETAPACQFFEVGKVQVEKMFWETLWKLKSTR